MILCVMQQQCLISISDGPPAIPQIKAGKVRALAVTGARALAAASERAEHGGGGLPEVNTKLWSGFFAPAKTPPAIAAKLEAALRKAITDPGVSAKLREMAVTPRRHRLGRLPQDDRRRHPELRRGGEGGEFEVRVAAP